MFVAAKLLLVRRLEHVGVVQGRIVRGNITSARPSSSEARIITVSFTSQVHTLERIVVTGMKATFLIPGVHQFLMRGCTTLTIVLHFILNKQK